MTVQVKVWNKKEYENGGDPKREAVMYRENILQVEGHGEDMVIEVDYEDKEKSASFVMRVAEIKQDIININSDEWNRIYREKFNNVRNNSNPEFDRTERVTLHKKDKLVVEDVVILRLDNFSRLRTTDTVMRGNITKMNASLE